MSGMWGNRLQLSIFGESHGEGIGIVINGLPVGFSPDLDEVKRQMTRRMGGQDPFSTARKEPDEVEIVSGLFENCVTGAPLCGMIRNTDKRSGDYAALKERARPSHADYTGFIKYRGFNDPRGGGHFSGRITAPLVFAGSLARQVLAQKGIAIGGHIRSIGPVEDRRLAPEEITADVISKLTYDPFPVLSPEKGEEMRKEILDARSECDSVGGRVEIAVTGLPAGLGEPFFDSMESVLSHLLFSVPAVKGVSFGSGFDIAAMRGSKANDPLCTEDGKIKTKTNHNGGICGGITNGMPLVFEVAVKPTPSIAQEQDTVNLRTLEAEKMQIKGRHDPCIVPRAVVVLESVAALGILEMLLRRDGEGC